MPFSVADHIFSFFQTLALFCGAALFTVGSVFLVCPVYTPSSSASSNYYDSVTRGNDTNTNVGGVFSSSSPIAQQKVHIASSASAAAYSFPPLLMLGFGFGIGARSHPPPPPQWLTDYVRALIVGWCYTIGSLCFLATDALDLWAAIVWAESPLPQQQAHGDDDDDDDGHERAQGGQQVGEAEGDEGEGDAERDQQHWQQQPAIAEEGALPPNGRVAQATVDFATSNSSNVDDDGAAGVGREAAPDIPPATVTVVDGAAVPIFGDTSPAAVARVFTQSASIDDNDDVSSSDDDDDEASSTLPLLRATTALAAPNLRPLGLGITSCYDAQDRNGLYETMGDSLIFNDDRRRRHYEKSQRRRRERRSRKTNATTRGAINAANNTFSRPSPSVFTNSSGSFSTAANSLFLEDDEEQRRQLYSLYKVWFNIALSISADVTYVIGSVAFLPAIEGHPFGGDMGNYGFIVGSGLVMVSQSWKILRALTTADRGVEGAGVPPSAAQYEAGTVVNGEGGGVGDGGARRAPPPHSHSIGVSPSASSPPITVVDQFMALRYPQLNQLCRVGIDLGSFFGGLSFFVGTFLYADTPLASVASNDGLAIWLFGSLAWVGSALCLFVRRYVFRLI